MYISLSLLLFLAIQQSLEYFRQRQDAWNPLLAGSWTGFIFGRSIGKDVRMGVAGAVNGALLTWLLQSVSVSKVKGLLVNASQSLNPLADDAHAHLYARITQLQSEIVTLKAQKDEK